MAGVVIHAVRRIAELREVLDGNALGIHERRCVPAENVAARTGVDRRLVRRVAHPNASGDVRRDADEADVLVIFRRARLARDLLAVPHSRVAAGTALHHAHHDALRGVSLLVAEHARGVVFRIAPIEDDIAVLVFDRGDGAQVVAHAAVRNGGHGTCQLERRDVLNAERQRRAGDVFLEVGRDAEVMCGLGGLLHTDRRDEAHETGVRRDGESACDGAVAIAGVVVVFQRVAVDRGRRAAIDVGRVRIDALANGRDHRKRLEHRTARTTGAALAGGDVNLARVIVRAADDGLHVTRLRVDGSHGHLHPAVAHAVEFLTACVFRRLLRRDVERRVHAQAAAQDVGLGKVVVVVQQLAHVTGEVRVCDDAVLARDLRIKRKRLGHGRIVLLLADVVFAQHGRQHDRAPVERVFRIERGIVVRGRLRDAREQRGFRQRQLVGRLREVAARSGLDAVGAGAVVNRVEVHVQDVVFGMALLDFRGDEHLAGFALQRDIVHLAGEDGVAHELLGDGGCAFDATAGQVVGERAHDAVVIDAAMLVEAGVLGGDGGLDQAFADLIEVDRFAILQLEAREHRGAVGCVDVSGQRRVKRFGAFVIGKVLEPGADRGVSRNARGAERDDDDRKEAENERHGAPFPDSGSAFYRARTHGSSFWARVLLLGGSWVRS